MRHTVLALLALATAAGTAGAQVLRVPSDGAVARIERDDSDRAMLGVTTLSGGARDTLGLLISTVTSNGPADKAGLQEGDRIQSIDGVNLKLSPDDAGDRYMQGINQNRFMREMRKVKPGDEVTLQVWGGGRSRTVKVKTIAADALDSMESSSMARAFSRVTRDDDRAVLGVYLSATGTERDTAGVFVQQVVAGGPAEKAGVVEGDRVASINGVDLRVAREDAGDPNAASARVDRMQREVDKLKAGDAAELRVVAGGRSRTVRVTTAKAADVPGMGGTFSFGPGNGDVRTFRVPGRGVIVGPNGGGTIRAMPRMRFRRGTDDAEIRSQIEDGLQELRRIGPGVRAEVLDDLDRSLPRAMDELRETLRAVPVKVQVRSRVGMTL